MTNREIDTLCFGVVFGVPIGVWIGYKLRRAVERRRARRAQAVADEVQQVRRRSRHIPIGEVKIITGELDEQRTEQRLRQILTRKTRRAAKNIPFIPLAQRRDPDLPSASDGYRTRSDNELAHRVLIPIRALDEAPASFEHYADPGRVDLTALRHADVVAALVDAGYKRPAAVDAADACPPADRGSVEAWVVAALRRASSK